MEVPPHDPVRSRGGTSNGICKMEKGEAGKLRHPKDPLLNGDKLLHEGCRALPGYLGKHLE